MIVVAIQASEIDEDTLNEWVKEQDIPFSVGLFQGDEEKTRFAWGVRSLPWLILTDSRHIVIAEGVELNKLNDKIKATTDNPKAPAKKRPSASDSEEDEITKRRAWALGCSAVLIERNHGRHDLLGTDVRTDRNIAIMKKFLRTSGWDINNRADLLENLQWLESEGHRRNFEEFGMLLQTLNSQEYEQTLKRSEDNPELLHKIKITQKYYKQLGPKSIFGWDYTRYICLCRWGYMAGYLSEKEA